MNAQSKRETLNLRIKPEVRGKIDQAAALTGKSRTDFVLDAALRAAEEALLDRVHFVVDEAVYREFLAKLDEPPNESLRRLMATRPPWDE